MLFEVARGDGVAAAVDDVFDPAGDLQVTVRRADEAGHIEFEDVPFSYHGAGAPLLDGVIEDGRVDELLSAGGRFDEFWRQQQDAAEWRIHAG